jgi:hypothetical protein
MPPDQHNKYMSLVSQESDLRFSHSPMVKKLKVTPGTPLNNQERIIFKTVQEEPSEARNDQELLTSKELALELAKKLVTSNAISQFQKSTTSAYMNTQTEVLSYLGSKDKIYQQVPLLNKQALVFMRHAYPSVEMPLNRVTHGNERIRFQPVKSIEEHSSGIN